MKKAKKTAAKKTTAKKTISEATMMGMMPSQLEALGLSAQKKASLRARIADIQAHLEDMKNPFVYASLENVPLRRLRAFLVPNPGKLPLNDYRVE